MKPNRIFAPLVLSAACLAPGWAGEIFLLSDVPTKVNLDGRVLGVIDPGSRMMIQDIPDGRHKLYMKDHASGRYEMFLLELPTQNGATFETKFKVPEAEGELPEDSSPPMASPADSEPMPPSPAQGSGTPEGGLAHEIEARYAAREQEEAKKRAMQREQEEARIRAEAESRAQAEALARAQAPAPAPKPVETMAEPIRARSEFSSSPSYHPPREAFPDPGMESKIASLFDLHGVALDTLEVMDRRLQRVEDQRPSLQPAPTRREDEPQGANLNRVRIYGYVDADYSHSNATLAPSPQRSSPTDKGSFSLAEAVIGLGYDFGGNLTAAIEPRFARGGRSLAANGLPAAGTVNDGEISLDRAFLRHHGKNFDLTLGKVFNPLGAWTDNLRGPQRRTYQNPLMFETLVSRQQTGITAEGKYGNNLEWTLGLYNGDGLKPDEVDDNDNKGLLLEVALARFMDGSLSFGYNAQRDGRQAGRREEKFILSFEQDFKKAKVFGEYLAERGFLHTDSYYLDFQWAFDQKLAATLRLDDINRDPLAGGIPHQRQLVDLSYSLQEDVKVRMDIYHDKYDGGRSSGSSIDLAVTAALGG